jgi:hypothetical protein
MLTRSKKITEKFTDMVLDLDPEMKKTITDSFNTMLGREPNFYEFKMYSSMMSDPFDVEVVRDKLKGSDEYRKFIGNIQKEALVPPEKRVVNFSLIESFQQDMNIQDKERMQKTMDEMPFQKKLEQYKDIVKIFEYILQRIPTVDELNYFTFKVVTETDTFTKSHIQLVLEASPEYKMLKKNQTNLVNTDIVTNITDAQLVLIVDTVYMDVFNKENTDDQLREFLKRKLYDYALDRNKLKSLLILVNNFDMGTVSCEPLKKEVVLESDQVTMEQVTMEQVTMEQGTILQHDIIEEKSSIGEQASQPNEVNAMHPPSIPTPQPHRNKTMQMPTVEEPAVHMKLEKRSPLYEDDQICFNNPTKSCMAKSGYSNPFVDDLYENLKTFQDSDEYSKPADANELANVQQQRNLSELRYSCGNNTYFANLERQMATDASAYDGYLNLPMRNTKYGAFLEDAGNTKVGSIMPSFVYKEIKR